MPKKVIEFIVFSSIFIALCAVALCIETNFLLHLPLNDTGFYCFVFGATLVQYNFHYFIKKNANTGSKRLNWSARNIHIHKILLGIGCLFILGSLFTLHLKHYFLLGILGFISILYSSPFLPFPRRKRIKDFGLLKILTLSLFWTLVTVWLPIVETKFHILSFQLIFIRRFIFLFILCLLFDMRDIDVDSKENINTLPIILGIKKTYLLANTLVFVFMLLSVIEYLQLSDMGQLLAMLLSGVATFLVIYNSRNNKNDIYYLGIVDGMMLLQAALVIAGELYLH